MEGLRGGQWWIGYSLNHLSNTLVVQFLRMCISLFCEIKKNTISAVVEMVLLETTVRNHDVNFIPESLDFLY